MFFSFFFLNLQGPTEYHFRDVGSLYKDDDDDDDDDDDYYYYFSWLLCVELICISLAI